MVTILKNNEAKYTLSYSKCIIIHELQFWTSPRYNSLDILLKAKQNKVSHPRSENSTFGWSNSTKGFLWYYYWSSFIRPRGSSAFGRDSQLARWDKKRASESPELAVGAWADLWYLWRVYRNRLRGVREKGYSRSGSALIIKEGDACVRYATHV